jgi:hypothetical protein
MRVRNTSGLIPSGVGDRRSDKRGYKRERERERETRGLGHGVPSRGLQRSSKLRPHPTTHASRVLLKVSRVRRIE